MRNLGIVRRIDDLGRIAIPKDVRKMVGIEETDAMEIKIEGNKIILEKYYNPLEELTDNLDNLITYVESNLPNFDGDYLEDLHQCLRIVNKLNEG